MDTRITKLDAAKALLDQAIELYLSRKCDLSAIVLAGSAEDILQGLLGRQKHPIPGVREQLAGPLVQIRHLLDPDEPLMSTVRAFSVMRAPFNWLRHNDREGEPQEAELDFRVEAGYAIDRAIENLFMLTKIQHPRAAEVIAAQREHAH